MSTHNIFFPNIKKKIILNFPKCATFGYFQRTQERVRNSHGKRAISVRANEVVLYASFFCFRSHHSKSCMLFYIHVIENEK